MEKQKTVEKKKFNKKLLTFGILGLFALALVTGAVLQYFGQVQQEVTVDSAIVFTGENTVDAPISGGESVVSDDLLVESQTSVNVPLSIGTVTNSNGVGITHTTQFLLDVTGGQGIEDRVVVTGEDSVMNLEDLDSIEWNVEDGLGYAPHVDVFLDNEESLNFEYAKVDPNDCDDVTDYPTGDFNTFADKGIINDGAYAWLNSGPAGPCGDSAFDINYKSLAEWKTEYPNAKILKFEFEVDNWIEDSSAVLSNVLINGQPVEVTLLPGNSLDFNVETEFDINVVPRDYIITTTVDLR